jgi:hypothetical protein
LYHQYYGSINILRFSVLWPFSPATDAKPSGTWYLLAAGAAELGLLLAFCSLGFELEGRVLLIVFFPHLVADSGVDVCDGRAGVAKLVADAGEAYAALYGVDSVAVP